MKLSEMAIRLIGLILAVVGFLLLLTLANIHAFGIAVDSIWLALILGFVFLGVGIYIVRGGNVDL